MANHDEALLRDAQRVKVDDKAVAGTITFMEDERVVSVRNIEEVPESARFANRMMGDRAREIVEYGPNDERLRSTVARFKD